MRRRRPPPADPARRWDRGATGVEAALVTPVVVLMVFGIIEFGFFFKDWLATAASVRAGVRMASAHPRTATFAVDAAREVAQKGQALDMRNVQDLWVYKVDPTISSDKPIGRVDFADCSVCVKFRWDAATSSFLVLSDTWPAGTQNACGRAGPGGPPDRIGVYLNVRHNAFTGLVFSSLTVSEASVTSLEPMPVGSGCR